MRREIPLDANMIDSQLNNNMFTQISNGLLTARINHKGAELYSLYNHALQLEYMWEADPNYWAKTSPVLFPVVGALKDGKFIYEGREYTLPRHGFARDMTFEEEAREASKVTFLLRQNEETLKVFPFAFELRLTYELSAFGLLVSYAVSNPSSQRLYFSIGGHPAFRVPLVDGTTYEDYFLKFSERETCSRWPISTEGLLKSNAEPFLAGEDKLVLRRDLFYADAIVLKDLKSTTISIRSAKHAHGLDFSFAGFPFFGIWAFRDADFVCLEPWCGVADSVDHNQHLHEKEGVVSLDGKSSWSRSWSVKCY